MRSVSRSSILVRVLAFAIPALVAQAALAEAPKAEWPLWTATPQSLPPFDIDPARPGIEVPTFASACTISTADASGMITVTNQLKVKIYATDGVTVVMAPTTSNTVKSAKFPDPRWSRYQCNGANVTNYRAQFPGGDSDNAGHCRSPRQAARHRR